MPLHPFGFFSADERELRDVEILLSALQFVQYNWKVIGDFKMVTFLMTFQGDITSSPAICTIGIAEVQPFTTRREIGLSCPVMTMELIT